MNPDPGSLDRLHDIIAPPSAPIWPPAPGWLWLLGFLVVLAAAGAVRAIIHWQRNRYRREALAEWQRLQPLLTTPDRRAAGLAGLAELLKRTALSAFPREQVAALTGPAWLVFLDRTGATNSFSTGAGAVIETAAFDPRAAAAVDDARAMEAATLTREWLAHHQAATPPGDTPC